MKSRYGSSGVRGPDLWRLGLLPLLLLGSLCALTGVYWDIAWHIDIGRDTFFTLPHNFLYASILIVLLVSCYGLLRDHRSTPFHLPLGPLRLHPGLLMIAIAALLELAFAPLDELWHRLFGNDVALWAPMHLVGLLAMGVANLGGVVAAHVERILAVEERRKRLFAGIELGFGAFLLAWAMLLLAEFEYSIMQFPLVLHPVFLASFSSLVLVLVARLGLGRYAALRASLLFTALRAVIALLLMSTAAFDLAGHSRPMLPVLFVSALAVDLLLVRSLPSWLVGALAGLLTLLVNWLLVALGSGLQWPLPLVAAALFPTLLLSAGAGVLGSWVASALRGEKAVPRQAFLREERAA